MKTGNLMYFYRLNESKNSKNSNTIKTYAMMKAIRLIAMAAICATGIIGLSSWDGSDTEATELTIGQPIPLMAQQLVDVNGVPTTLREQLQMNGLLVVFSCNTCPFVMQWEDRYNDLYDLCMKNQIGMVLINSNEAKRDGDDSLEKMKEKAMNEGYKMPYLMDEDHKVADAFGARTTPHVFLFDGNPNLAYRGAIDDNSESKEAVTHPYLQDAINALMNKQPIDPNTTKSIGCSIKRVQAQE